MSDFTAIRSSDQIIIDADLDHSGFKSINQAAGIAGTDGVNVTQLNNAVAAALTYSSFIFNEAPTGTQNNINVTFTLANTPHTGLQLLTKNGLVLKPGNGFDYTISGNTITFTKAPKSMDVLLAFYLK